jgi:photoactive yellow protein
MTQGPRESPIAKETTMDCSFTDTGLFDRLEAADDSALDALPFGVVAMSEDGTVTGYNLEECRLSGLAAANVVGRNFFSSVAHRFRTEMVLDLVIDYVFTLRIRPSAVRLRLLKQPERRRMYLAVELR